MTATCTTSGFTSHIVFLVSSPTGLPNVLSGRVNDTVAFDECNGSDAYLYSITRTDANYAQVSIWLPPSAKVYDQYFDENNQPLPDPQLSYKIYGRPWCDSDEVIMTSGDTRLDWQPLYTVNTSCPQAGYSAVVR
ncbi:MAG: hypothetical protein KF799_01680 [Bdellovibrionales bacterium]|nr:hypothetical protein [Bdellovibrionales bacterium]